MRGGSFDGRSQGLSRQRSRESVRKRLQVDLQANGKRERRPQGRVRRSGECRISTYCPRWRNL